VTTKSGIVTAVIPVKSFRDAKSRLSSCLDAQSREKLARTMFLGVLEAVRGSRLLLDTFVVTADPEVSSLAQETGALVIHDHFLLGQSAAVRQAATLLKRQKKRAMLTFPSDLPLLTTKDIDTLCHSIPEVPGVVVVPAANDGGTNALLCTPPDCFEFHFGEDSYTKHLIEAKNRNLSFKSVDIRGFSLDIDRPDDLSEFMNQDFLVGPYAFLENFKKNLLLNVR
jgi:2-phospho-L-lactate guanylyltransferase